MQDDEAILREQGERDLRRAIWWCKREWFLLGLGALLALAGLIPSPWRDVPVVELSTGKRILTFASLGIMAVGFATGIVGWILSLPSSFVALLGILFPGKSGRHRFLLLFVVSALPFTITMWAATNVRLITVEDHKNKPDSEQHLGQVSPEAAPSASPDEPSR